MNTIQQQQITQKQLERLAGQRQLYSEAKRIQGIQMMLAGPFVALWSLVVVWEPQLRVYSALWGIFVTLLDTFLFSRQQRSLKQQAAKIQELFDCDVLHISWSDVKVGHRPDAEAIMEAASDFKRHNPDLSMLKNWYPAAVDKLPIHLGRLICQRSNCWWDFRLRRRYITYVTVSVVILTVFVVLAGFIGGMTLEKFTLAILAPLMPAFVLAMRQYNEHKEYMESSDRLKEYIEKLWSNAIESKVTPEELTIESRALQDEIYDRRRRSPLIFDWVYQRLELARRTDE